MAYLFVPLTLFVELAACCMYVWLRWRQLRTHTVTNALTLVVGQNIPLYDGLRAMARGERGANKRILDDIATQLALGDSVAKAVRSAHRGIPGDVLGAIQAGEEAGTLPTVLRNIDRRVRQSAAQQVGSTPAIVYFMLLTFFVFVHVFLVCTFLVPKFRDIFADFGVHKLPWPTEWLIAAVGSLHQTFGPLLALILFGAPLLLLRIVIGRYFSVRVPDRIQPLFRTLDALCWCSPGLRHIAQTRALVKQLPVMTASVRAGHDLPAAARHAARVDANWFARKRLTRWSEMMIAGKTPAEAAREAGLPAAFCGVVSRSRAQDPFVAELSYLSSYYERLANHWDRVTAGIVAPVLVLAASVLVGFVTIALYLPMRGLMNALMTEMY